MKKKKQQQPFIMREQNRAEKNRTEQNRAGISYH
jgi:hypothetical protein